MGAVLGLDDLIATSRAHPIRGHAIAIFLVALATLARLLLQRVGADAFPYGIFLLPVFFATLACGIGPGILALLAGAAIGRQFSFPAEGTYWPTMQDDARIFFYLLVGGFVLGSAALVRTSLGRTFERGRALRESEERLRRAQDGGGVGDWEWRPDVGSMRSSPSVARMVGRDPATYDLRGTGFRDTIHPDDLPTVEAELRKVAAGETERLDVEMRVVWPDGTIRWLAARGEAERDEKGQLVKLVGINFDVTELREAEENLRRANERLEERVEERTRELTEANRQLATEMTERERAEAALRQAQKMEAIGQLTGGVAHDFNNLLTAIGGNLDLLRRHIGGDERASQLLASALRSTERGARLTSHLLAFARRQRLALEAVDINRVVTGMESLLQSTLGANVRVATVLAQPLAPALADASQMELVILNLAINARDAMPGGGTITIRTERRTVGAPTRAEEPAAGDYVMISVSDTGTGIPPEILDKVFEPFFTTKEVGKGSGLGLPQVLGVMQQTGGGVRILSESGKGTTVQVFLPLARGVHATPPAKTETDPLPPPEKKSGKILLIDDDAEVRLVVADMLEVSGFQVTVTASGPAGLALLDQDAGFALAIVDFAMPGMDGAEVARRIRRQWPRLPFLIISGFTDAEALVREFGPSIVLQKPFYAEEIAERASLAIGKGA